jgi:hypothetical protein
MGQQMFALQNKLKALLWYKKFKPPKMFFFSINKVINISETYTYYKILISNLSKDVQIILAYLHTLWDFEFEPE